MMVYTNNPSSGGQPGLETNPISPKANREVGLVAQAFNQHTLEMKAGRTLEFEANLICTVSSKLVRAIKTPYQKQMNQKPIKRYSIKQKQRVEVEKAILGTM